MSNSNLPYDRLYRNFQYSFQYIPPDCSINRSFQKCLDISEMNDLLSNQEVYIGMNIGNYDKGGHKVSLNLTLHPEEISKKTLQNIPLFNTNNIMEMAGHVLPFP